MQKTRSDPNARRRLVGAAADMLRRHGLNATSIRELAKHAKTPLGSTYHYFPGGKQQMVTEAVRFAGEAVGHTLSKELEAGPLKGVRAFLALWREVVVSTSFRAGCPVLAVSTEEPLAEEGGDALAAAAEVFEAWESLLVDSLRQHGADRRHAAQLATLIVAAAEGGIAMCRAKRSVQPLDRVAGQLEALVSAAIGG